VAKNRNNQNRRPEQNQDQQRNSAMDPQEQERGHQGEERMMPSAGQAPRGKQQKRFGHN
jgi:hypothetical protein